MTQPIDRLLISGKVTVYQAPFPRARRRFTRSDAAKDYAHWLVTSHLARRCGCEPGDAHGGPPFECAGHRAARVWKEAGDLDMSIEAYDALEPRGVFHPEVRAGMKRRIFRALFAGWIPSPELLEELEEARRYR